MSHCPFHVHKHLFALPRMIETKTNVSTLGLDRLYRTGMSISCHSTACLFISPSFSFISGFRLSVLCSHEHDYIQRKTGSRSSPTHQVPLMISKQARTRTKLAPSVLRGCIVFLLSPSSLRDRQLHDHTHCSTSRARSITHVRTSIAHPCSCDDEEEGPDAASTGRWRFLDIAHSTTLVCGRERKTSQQERTTLTRRVCESFPKVTVLIAQRSVRRHAARAWKFTSSVHLLRLG